MYHDKISIFPAKNLVKNIGFTQEATHTIYPDHPIAKFELQSLNFPLLHPHKIDIDEAYEEEYIKKVWCGNKKESLFSILKTRLLYIPVIHRMNAVLKKSKSTIN